MQSASEPRRKSYLRCCVINCPNSTNNSPNLEFYSFPTDNMHFPHKKARREEWLKAIKLLHVDGSTWTPKHGSIICSAHFIGGKKNDDPRSPSYNPVIFPSIYKKANLNSQQAINRYKRRLKREREDHAPVNTTIQSKQSTTEQDEFLEQDIRPENTSVESLDETFKKIDVAIHVDFVDKTEDFLNVFMCNRFAVDSTFEAETQASLPNPSKKVIFNSIEIVKKKTSHKEALSKQKRRILYQQIYNGRNQFYDKLNSRVKGSNNSGFHGFKSLTSEQELIDLAGVSFKVFNLLMKVLLHENTNLSKRNKVQYQDRLLIFLMKMKCGLTFSVLSVLFRLHRTTVSRIFLYILQVLAMKCKNFVFWPEKEVVQETMPTCFKPDYKNCRVIIDATEFEVEQPSTIELKVKLYSHYKKGYRIKIIIGCTPCGFISFVSSCHGGRSTDAQITVASAFINLLEPGDMVLADKGFPQITNILNERRQNVLLIMPPFLHNGQFTEEEIDNTYNIAKVRIHIERIIQRIRTHKIVDKFSIDMLPYVDDIIFMCCVLVNLQSPIIQNCN